MVREREREKERKYKIQKNRKFLILLHLVFFYSTELCTFNLTFNLTVRIIKVLSPVFKSGVVLCYFSNSRFNRRINTKDRKVHWAPRNVSAEWRYYMYISVVRISVLLYNWWLPSNHHWLMSVWKCLVFFLVIKKAHPIILDHTSAVCLGLPQNYPFYIWFAFSPSSCHGAILKIVHRIVGNGGEERRLSIITAVKSRTDLSVKSGSTLDWDWARLHCNNMSHLFLGNNWEVYK